MLNFELVARFQSDGYLLLKSVFSRREIAVMLRAVESGERVARNVSSPVDSGGRKSSLSLWNELGNDVWAAASTSPRIVNNIRVLLGEEISFFHGKVMHKEAHTGGVWEWHQDYGYWYDQGFVFPRLMSAFVALDPATRENGCLQVLRGSHQLGRLSHGKVGDQTGADEDRMALIESQFERDYCEMAPGDVLFFHCNLLHASGPNDSDRHRRAFIMCYNALANPQLGNPGRTGLPPCPVSEDDAILRHAVEDQSP